MADVPVLLAGASGLEPRKSTASRSGQAVTSAAVLAIIVGFAMAGAGWWAGFALLAIGVGLLVAGLSRLRPRSDVAMWFAIAWIALIVVLAIAAPLLPLAEHKLASKTFDVKGYLTPKLWSSHPLGTNSFGLDELARVIWGARVSLVTSLVAAGIGFVIGGIIGLVAGFLGGFTDRSVGVLTDAVLAFPGIILLIALAAALKPGVSSSILGLSILAIPTNVRLARANAIAHKERDYVTAARVLGAGRTRIIFREVLPSVVVSMLAFIFVLIAVLIVAEASLSFLGLGVQQPTPTWGNMVAEGDGGVFTRYPHTVIVPGMAIFLTVLSFNLLGERFRDRLEGREQSSTQGAG